MGIKEITSMENKNGFNTFNLSDLLRAIKYCKKNYDIGVLCSS